MYFTGKNCLINKKLKIKQYQEKCLVFLFQLDTSKNIPLHQIKIVSKAPGTISHLLFDFCLITENDSSKFILYCLKSSFENDFWETKRPLWQHKIINCPVTLFEGWGILGWYHLPHSYVWCWTLPVLTITWSEEFRKIPALM